MMSNEASFNTSASPPQSPPPNQQPSITESLINTVNTEQVDEIIDRQNQMLTRLEKTNEMLVNLNALSVVRYENANRELKRHTQMLVDLKKDLDVIFRRIRGLKTRLAQKHPEAFNACSKALNVVSEDEEEEESVPVKEEMTTESSPQEESS